MTKLDLSYNIVDYTPAAATPVDTNFKSIEEYVNQELIERDGTVAMRAQLKLVGDPVNELDAAPKQYVDQVLPIGLILMYGGTSVPPGGKWAICNGAELQTAEYSALYNVIGHNFSPAGTPGSRFNLPNLSDRMPMGLGTATTIGETGGTRNAVVVAHTHPIPHSHTINHDHGTVNTSTSANHSHTVPRRLGATGQGEGVAAAAGTLVSNNTFTTNADGDHYHSVNLPAYSGSSGGSSAANSGAASSGVSGTDQNLPPFLGVRFVIRVK